MSKNKRDAKSERKQRLEFRKISYRGVSRQKNRENRYSRARLGYARIRICLNTQSEAFKTNKLLKYDHVGS